MKAAKETAPAVVEQKAVEVAPTPEYRIQGEIIPSDIIIPKLMLMQGLSKFVADRKAQMGDMVRSTTAEKIGSPEQAIDFIPLSLPQATWVIELKNAKDKWAWKKSFAKTASNSGLPWNFWADENGEEVPAGTPNAIQARRVQRLTHYALLPGDVDAELAEKAKVAKGEFPDFSKALMPVLVGYRGYSYKGGQEVVSFFTQAASFGQPAWKAVIKLGCETMENDDGIWYIYKVDRSKPVPVKKEHLATVERWAKLVATTALKVDESQDEDGNSNESSGGAASSAAVTGASIC